MVVIWWLWDAWGQRNITAHVFERHQIRKAVGKFTIIESRRGTGCVFLIFKKGMRKDSGGDLVVVRCMGTKKHYACVFERHQIRKAVGKFTIIESRRGTGCFLIFK